MKETRIAYYRNGMLYNVYPRDKATSLYENRGVAYKADIIVSDGKQYNLSSIKDILSIPIPNFPRTWDILELSYITKIRCGGESNPELIEALVEKTLELMQASNLLWRRKDYLQVIRNFYRLGQFSKGDQFEKFYRSTNRAVFSDPRDESHELEHERTKEYFRKKWEKKVTKVGSN